MQGKLFKKLSANTLQLVINQLFGLAVFLILSAGLDKNTFGQINLTLAILLAVFNILSFGVDQLVVKKIAFGIDPAVVLSNYLFHVFLTGLFFYSIIIALNLILPQPPGVYKLLLLIGSGKLLIYFSTPFKQLAMGFERFGLLLRMSVISSVTRSIALLLFFFFHNLSLISVIAVFVTGDALELLVSIILFQHNLKIPFHFNWNCRQYFQLLKECIPQVGVAIITSALARFDWIFIGLMVSSVKLAEYSFAYKVFEMSTLPLLALAPLLIPRFTQIFKSGGIPADGMRSLLKLEMMLAVFVAMVLCIVWAPLADLLTHHKYGSVNQATILILSLSMPLLYINNYLWSISFAKGHLKKIFTVIVLTFAVNLAGDVILIPFFKNEGAATAYLLAMVVQCIAYLKINTVAELNNCWLWLLFYMLFGLLSACIAISILNTNWLVVMFSASLYIGMILISKQLRPALFKNIGSVLN